MTNPNLTAQEVAAIEAKVTTASAVLYIYDPTPDAAQSWPQTKEADQDILDLIATVRALRVMVKP